MPIQSIAIFASGTGTNAQNLISFFKHSDQAQVKLIVCNSQQAGVIAIAKQENINCLCIANEELALPNKVLNALQEAQIDFIVLAGFLRKVPADVLQHYQGRIINIHPALLPKFGGKGMYGKHVHQAVIDAKEKESGITIHHVTENYDEGKIIFQAKVEVAKNDTAESLAKKIQELEHKYLPEITLNVIRDGI